MHRQPGTAQVVGVHLTAQGLHGCQAPCGRPVLFPNFSLGEEYGLCAAGDESPNLTVSPERTISLSGLPVSEEHAIGERGDAPYNPAKPSVFYGTALDADFGRAA